MAEPICPNNVTVRHHNSATYEGKSPMNLGPKIRNKPETSYNKLKEYIALWNNMQMQLLQIM